MSALFVTGTDTGVGKTVVAAGIARLLKEEGNDVGVMKPVSCGVNPHPGTGKWVHADTQFLMGAISSCDPEELVNPVQLKDPFAPTVAAGREGTEVDLVKLHQAFLELKRRHEILIVEGVGGLLVPIRRGYLVSDLIREWNLPVLIVGRIGLGTINHTLLTIRQALSQDLLIRGVVLNRTENRPDGIAEKTNASEIEAESNIRIVGTLPFDPEVDISKGRYGDLSKAIRQNINLQHLFPKEGVLKP